MNKRKQLLFARKGRVLLKPKLYRITLGAGDVAWESRLVTKRWIKRMTGESEMWYGRRMGYSFDSWGKVTRGNVIYGIDTNY